MSPNPATVAPLYLGRYVVVDSTAHAVEFNESALNTVSSIQYKTDIQLDNHDGSVSITSGMNTDETPAPTLTLDAGSDGFIVFNSAVKFSGVSTELDKLSNIETLQYKNSSLIEEFATGLKLTTDLLTINANTNFNGHTLVGVSQIKYTGSMDLKDATETCTITSNNNGQLTFAANDISTLFGQNKVIIRSDHDIEIEATAGSVSFKNSNLTGINTQTFNASMSLSDSAATSTIISDNAGKLTLSSAEMDFSINGDMIKMMGGSVDLDNKFKISKLVDGEEPQDAVTFKQLTDANDKIAALEHVLKKVLDYFWRDENYQITSTLDIPTGRD